MPLTSAEKDQKISETHDTVVRMEAFLKAHVDNPVIHQVPPCYHHKNLAQKLWGLLVLCVGGIGTGLYAVMKVMASGGVK